MNLMRLNAVRTEVLILEEQIEPMRAKGPSSKEDRLARLRASAAEKMRLGHLLTRDEVGAHLGFDRRTIQRMEAAGRLTRCPGLGTNVRFHPSDVRRLASAMGKEI